MKKLYPYATYLAAAAGVLGALLRFWLLSAGTDENGLYPSGHPGWILYLVLTVGVLVFLRFLTKAPGSESAWQPNFPAGVLPALSHVLAGCGIAFYSISQIGTGGLLTMLSCLTGFFAAASFLLLGWQRFSGSQPASMAYLIPCLHFALQLFCMGRDFSAEPELLRYFPQLLAIGASALACYQLWGFGVGMGNREKSLFWTLTAAYLCLAAAPGQQVIYIGLALWHLLGHCALILPPAEPENDPTQMEEM